MNSVDLVGRITHDPKISYTGDTQMCVAHFSVAAERPRRKDNPEKETDFPRIVAFGKLAEIIERYGIKGKLVSVHGSLQTKTYERKDGIKIFNMEVKAERIELLSPLERREPKPKEEPVEYETPDDFEQVDEDVPF